MMVKIVKLIALIVFCTAVSAQTRPSAIDAKPCTQARVRDHSARLAAMAKPPTAAKARQFARSTLTRSLERAPASATTWLSQLRRDVESKVAAGDIDFSNMPVEDAVMLLFALIAEDAERDLKEMLEGMKGRSREKEALREKAAALREHICYLQGQTRKADGDARGPRRPRP